jgi:hypothetical protein
MIGSFQSASRPKARRIQQILQTISRLRIVFWTVLAQFHHIFRFVLALNEVQGNRARDVLSLLDLDFLGEFGARVVSWD